MRGSAGDCTYMEPGAKSGCDIPVLRCEVWELEADAQEPWIAHVLGFDLMRGVYRD